MLETSALPEPSAAAAVVSAELGASIAQAIGDAGGHIGFDEYMRRALYEPGLGYYVGGTIKFGKDGDFVTGPELSPLFGACIARSIREVLRHVGAGSVLEFGAGSGALAASVLSTLAASDELPRTYTIIELSPDLRDRQRETIAARAPDCVDRVTWVQGVPEEPMDGVVIANEIIDALPVRCFKLLAGDVLERCVGITHDRFDWIETAAPAAFVEHVRARFGEDFVGEGSGYRSEINVGVEPWIADLGRFLRRGAALIVDYGYPEREYYHPDRSAGTLMCHYRQRAHDNPFSYPGLQDITASVDFTHVAEAAYDCGFRVAGFTEQSSFLLGTGLLDDVAALSESGDEAHRQRLAYETKVLTLPTEMGARFKFLGLTKDYERPLGGFQIRDDRHRL